MLFKFVTHALLFGSLLLNTSGTCSASREAVSNETDMPTVGDNVVVPAIYLFIN
jgi:hypothetical protein